MSHGPVASRVCGITSRGLDRFVGNGLCDDGRCGKHADGAHCSSHAWPLLAPCTPAGLASQKLTLCLYNCGELCVLSGEWRAAGALSRPCADAALFPASGSGCLTGVGPVRVPLYDDGPIPSGDLKPEHCDASSPACASALQAPHGLAGHAVQCESIWSAQSVVGSLHPNASSSSKSMCLGNGVLGRSRRPGDPRCAHALWPSNGPTHGRSALARMLPHHLPKLLGLALVGLPLCRRAGRLNAGLDPTRPAGPRQIGSGLRVRAEAGDAGQPSGLRPCGPASSAPASGAALAISTYASKQPGLIALANASKLIHPSASA
mmetsp:Transcript_20773/g.57051  ORF Transcript_20773/g.57051 Transcript_20773/m.57051 type:complete len:319 (+) Transcript_20773:414-1370(+)